ncbi:RNA polymerase [Streptomyces sp. WAC 04229]|uniref:sigma-70 family RNA polymerase sigma factor n=1 Tax=Streptomyces sp. WAC 04229 TaxID=2203206 RepID=UPI000F747D4F|nr:sigma-70 family RNA polymerase sigma factor [Streptomyces sp. WAC 04229]RSN54005.1 RNA polymerase [Streptomyces sp. WAC 04229]
MNDNEHAEHVGAGSGGDPIGVYTRLPLSYQALYLSDQTAFHDYAFVVLEDNEAAESAVHTAMTRVQDNWNELLVESNMQQQVWAIMRQTVEEYRQDAEDRAAIAHSLSTYRQGLGRLNSEQGVFEALAGLPPQQFDAVVLRYILGIKPQRIGWYMGLSEQTVNYHCRQGKQRIEQAVPTLLKKDSDAITGAGSETDTKD